MLLIVSLIRWYKFAPEDCVACDTRACNSLVSVTREDLYLLTDVRVPDARMCSLEYSKSKMSVIYISGQLSLRLFRRLFLPFMQTAG